MCFSNPSLMDLKKFIDWICCFVISYLWTYLQRESLLCLYLLQSTHCSLYRLTLSEYALIGGWHCCNENASHPSFLRNVAMVVDLIENDWDLDEECDETVGCDWVGRKYDVIWFLWGLILLHSEFKVIVTEFNFFMIWDELLVVMVVDKVAIVSVKAAFDGCNEVICYDKFCIVLISDWCSLISIDIWLVGDGTFSIKWE